MEANIQQDLLHRAIFSLVPPRDSLLFIHQYIEQPLRKLTVAAFQNPRHRVIHTFIPVEFNLKETDTLYTIFLIILLSTAQ